MARTAWNKGKHWSEETKTKISRAKMGQSAGAKNPNFGKFGKDHPKFNPNKRRPLVKQIRETFKYRQWRSDIFTRDNFTCVLCGDRNHKGRGTALIIEADHFPKRFSEILDEYSIVTVQQALDNEELWNINNGRTLCKKCHDPTRGRYKKPIN